MGVRVRLPSAAPAQNFLFDTNPRLWRGFLVGQEVFSLPNATHCVGLAFGGDAELGLA